VTSSPTGPVHLHKYRMTCSKRKAASSYTAETRHAPKPSAIPHLRRAWPRHPAYIRITTSCIHHEQPLETVSDPEDTKMMGATVDATFRMRTLQSVANSRTDAASHKAALGRDGPCTTDLVLRQLLQIVNQRLGGGLPVNIAFWLGLHKILLIHAGANSRSSKEAACQGKEHRQCKEHHRIPLPPVLSLHAGETVCVRVQCSAQLCDNAMDAFLLS
jgi:hypothetical protein